jgi:hypothetical protein
LRAKESEAPLMSSKLNIDDMEGRFNVSSFSNIILELILILRF